MLFITHLFVSVEFDELLDQPPFSAVEKIKTVGTTYMAASGLNPTHKVILERFIFIDIQISLNFFISSCSLTKII